MLSPMEFNLTERGDPVWFILLEWIQENNGWKWRHTSSWQKLFLLISYLALHTKVVGSCSVCSWFGGRIFTMHVVSMGSYRARSQGPMLEVWIENCVLQTTTLSCTGIEMVSVLCSVVMCAQIFLHRYRYWREQFRSPLQLEFFFKIANQFPPKKTTETYF